MRASKKSSLHIWIISICILNLLVRLPFANLKAGLWDDTTYIHAVELISKNHLNPFIEYWGYKPPIMFMIPALFFRLFSASLIFVRLQTFIFSSLAIYLTYRLGKKLRSEWVGFAAAILLCFTPLFTAQSFYFLDTTYLTVFLVATLYWYFVGSPIGYILCGSLLVLTKEPAVFIPVAIFLFDIVKDGIPKKIHLRLFTKRLFLLTPLIPFVLWLLINKKLLGWYLWPTNTSLLFALENFQRTLTPLLVLLSVRRACIEYGMWMIWGSIIGGLILLKKCTSAKDAVVHKLAIFFISLFCFYFLFYLVSSYLHRYLLFLFPLLFILCCSFFERFLPTKKTLIVGGILVFFLTSNAYHAGWAPISWDGDNDLSLFRYIRLRQKAIEYLTEQYPHAIIYTDTPISTSWTTPLYGFVKTPGISIMSDDPTEILRHYAALPAEHKNAVVVTSPGDSKVSIFAAQQLPLITTIRLPTLSKKVYDEMNIYQMPQ